MAQTLTTTVIERGYTPFVVIRPENDASRSLYTKLGFRKAFNTVRVTLIPHAEEIKVNGHHRLDIDNEADTQKDEGIEDMRVELPENMNLNANDVANDEGIDEDA